MRKPRLTWEGAYHHVMNRGIDGLAIFNNTDLKRKFHSFISEFSKKHRIRIFAYCIMDNHYHLILQNSSGMLSLFMQSLNGSYGAYYRKKSQSKGYVFQSRFKSTLIENDSYLTKAIVYTLNNPVRSNLVSDPLQYSWSSAHLYFSTNKVSFLDSAYVEELFQSQENLRLLLNKKMILPRQISHTPFGEIYGSEKISLSITNDRNNFFRSIEHSKHSGFQSMEKTICFFEKKYGIKIDDIDTRKISGKKLRRKLLILLRDKSMMKYSEISDLWAFSDVKESSLRHMYCKEKSK